MFKMKSALYIVAIFSLALVACTERIENKEMPDVQNGATTMVTAAVKPLVLEGLDGVGNYQWGEKTKIGIISAGVNECYLPVQTTTGDNEAYFYGNVVSGDLTVYAPYSNENGTKANSGRLAMLNEQTYYADPFDHLMYNSTFLASTSTDHVEFDYYAGLIKVAIKHYSAEQIASVTLRVGNISSGFNDFVSGDYSINENELNDENNCYEYVKVTIGEEHEVVSSEESPAHVWVAVAPGTYENFVVIVSYRNGESITLPVAGPFVVKTKAVSADCNAEKEDHDNSIKDFEGKDDQFNEDKPVVQPGEENTGDQPNEDNSVNNEN